MEAALIAELLATSGITTLTGQRINWVRRPQGETIPAGKGSLVLHRIDGAPSYHLTGPSGLVESRVQADCWALSYGAAKALARAVEDRVSGARFVRGAIRFDAILIIDERDSTFDENNTPLFRTSIDLAVHHARAS